MGKRKTKKNSTSSIKDASTQPVTEQQQRPTRKRGRPRKIVIEEKDQPEGALESIEVKEQESADKKPRAGTEEQQQEQQQHTQQKEAESSRSAAAGEVTRQEEKPRSRGRRKGQPHKST